MIMTEKEFAVRLAKLREQKGISARDMSLSIGQNPGYINNIENEKSMPSMQGFFYICEFLNISPSTFFDETITYPDRLSSLIEDMKKLDDMQLAAISVIIKGLLRK